MTVQNNVARDQYIATSGQTVFSYTFEITAADGISVWQTPSGQEPDDTADLLQYLVDYTLTGIGVETGGTVVLVSGATLNDRITIQSSIPVERDTSFTPAGVIRAEDLNIEFDNQTLIEQKIQTILDKLVPKYASAALVAARDLVLPVLGNNQIWQMDTDVNKIQAVDYDPEETAAALAAALASHDAGEGASLVGLQGAGTVQDLANTQFIVKTASVGAPNAQVLGSLGTGILKNTTTTGTLSISAPLTSIDALTTVADQMIYTTGVDTYATATLTPFARTILDDVNALAVQTTLGLVIGTNVQAFDATLQSLSALGTAANKFAYTTGVDTWAEADITAFGRSLVDDADSTAARVTMGVVIGTDVQAYDATLQSLSALGTVADRIAYTTGVDTWAETPLTAAARTVLDDTTVAAMLATLGGVALAGSTMSGALILNTSSPSTDLQAASKGYVDSVAQGRSYKDPCVAATTANFSATYANGSSGIGATLTGTVMAAHAPDGVTIALGDRVLFKNQSSSFENGIYVATTLGTGAVLPVYTRSTDMDLAAEFKGATTLILNGSTQTGNTYTETATVVTIGTDAVTFALTGTQVTTPVSLGQGGTGAALVASNGGIFYSTGTTGAILSGTATANQILMSGSSAAPSWSTATYPATAGTSGNFIKSDGTNFSSAAFTAPTQQRFTSGSGTYTTPAGVLYIRVRMVGGGGGGGAGSSNNDGGTGGTGGTTTFGTSLLTCTGGAGGTGTTGGAGGAGGSATLNSPAYGSAFSGSKGTANHEAQGVLNTYLFVGADGAGSSLFGGGGAGGALNTAGTAGTTNTGGGGGGGANSAGAASQGGRGGGSGASIDAIITSPSSTYSYAVGAAGTAGATGTGGFAGGAGSAGYIEVTEYYQ